MKLVIGFLFHLKSNVPLQLLLFILSLKQQLAANELRLRG